MTDTAMPHASINGTAGAMDLAVGAARRGAADAREAADRFAATAGLFAARFLYTTCYTIAYGVVFPSVMIARSIPRDNAAVRGLIDGAGAATEKAEALLAPSESPPLALTTG